MLADVKICGHYFLDRSSLTVIFSQFASHNGILPTMSKYFTLQQANEALESIRPWMDEIQVIRQQILAHQPEIWSVMEKSAGNGGNPTLSHMVPTFDRLDELIHSLQATGVVIKDINTGLLDFPAMKEGREVYLCWQHGEGEISFWHEIDAGFAGRRSIDEF
jgi:hypothetical protein